MRANRKNSICKAKRCFVTVFGCVLKVFLLTVVAFRGKYYPVIHQVLGEATAEAFLTFKRAVFDFTGNMFWEIICSVLFGVSAFNYIRIGCYCFRKSDSNVYVEKIEVKEKLIRYEKKAVLSERKDDVCDVFEIVPSFLN